MTIEAFGALIAIILSVASFATAIIRGRAERAKLNAEAADIIGGSWDKLVGKLEGRIANLEIELDKRTKASYENETEIARLKNVVEDQSDRLKKQENRLLAQEAEIQILNNEVVCKNDELTKSKAGSQN
jgi:F420-0:gamma-glutamyl ligase